MIRLFASIALLLLLLLLAACQSTPVVPARVVAPAIAVSCPKVCTQSCLPERAPDGAQAWPQWGGDPNDPRTWDRIYPDAVDPVKEIARRCDAARDACVQCIGRVERAGVLCGVTLSCTGGGDL